jgi:hypothetical protein
MLLLYLIVVIQLALLAVVSWAVYQLFWDTRIDATKLRAWMVAAVADFGADVLEHPRTQLVLNEIFRNGINHTMEQPDLGSRLRKVSEYMADDNLQMSRSIGEQLPGLAANFVSGAVSSFTGKKNKSNNPALGGGSRVQPVKEVSSLSLDGSGMEYDATKKAK